MNNLDVLVVIPARGGSKGIPRKNLKKVGGIPLVTRAIQCGLNATSVTRTVVSTDDNEIAEVSRQAGAEVIIRSSDLADDKAPTLPVLIHVVDEMVKQGWEPDLLVLLEPTSPFRTSQVVDDCIKKFVDPEVQSVVTVSQVKRNPFNIFVTKGDKAEHFIKEPINSFTQRQQFTHLKHINGCVYAVRVNTLRAGSLISQPLRIVEMSEYRSINIDTPLDFEIANLIADCHQDLLDIKILC